jgi:hypothetical protein
MQAANRLSGKNQQPAARAPSGAAVQDFFTCREDGATGWIVAASRNDVSRLLAYHGANPLALPGVMVNPPASARMAKAVRAGARKREKDRARVGR